MIRLYAVYMGFWCLFVGWIKMTELKTKLRGEEKLMGANPKQSELRNLSARELLKTVIVELVVVNAILYVKRSSFSGRTGSRKVTLSLTRVDFVAEE